MLTITILVHEPGTQQTQHICITFIQRRPNVFDVGPTLYKVIQMFCVHWVGSSVPQKGTQCHSLFDMIAVSMW